MANNDGFELSRRKILAGLGSIGVASAGVGLGTSAYFSDEESFTNNQLVAGALDMKVSWEEHYSDWSQDEAEAAPDVRMVEGTEELEPGEVGLPTYDDPLIAVPEGQLEPLMNATLQEQFPDDETREQIGELPPEVDPCEALADVPGDLTKPVIDLEDVKPGDFGEVTFDFTICDNPGYVWLTGGLVDAAENGLTEPERKDDDEKEGVVELLDEIEVTVWYDSGDNVLSETETYVTDRSVSEEGNPISSAVALTGDQRIVAQGTLREVLGRLSIPPGIPLDGIPNDEERDCFAPTPTIHYVGVAWSLPVDHANEIQTDSVTFDLGFYTEQCRHNDGIGLSSGLSGYYPLDTVWDGVAEDLSGNGNDGTVVGDVSSVGGQVGKAAECNGVDEYISISDNPSLDIQDEITISFWFSLTGQSDDNNYPRAVSKGQSTTNNGAYGVFIEDAGGDPTRIGLRFIDTDGNRHDVDTDGLPNYDDGQWHHVAVSYSNDADTGHLWLDGTEYVDRTISGDVRIRTTTDDLHIGDGNGDRHLNGELDDVRIYDRALSEAEVQAIYANTS
jgi:predicted ribosomally synthesized peptide with SipW-like signal peptide